MLRTVYLTLICFLPSLSLSLARSFYISPTPFQFYQELSPFVFLVCKLIWASILFCSNFILICCCAINYRLESRGIVYSFFFRSKDSVLGDIYSLSVALHVVDEIKNNQVVLYYYYYYYTGYSCLFGKLKHCIRQMDKEEGNACALAADGRPSYWLDACEDVPCDDYFIDFEPATITSIPEPESHSQGGCHDPCFFGGIDPIVDSLKNDLPTHATAKPSRNAPQYSCSSAQQAHVQDQHSVSRPAIVNCNGKRPSVCSNGFKNDETDNGKRHHEVYDADQRHDKKIRGRDPKKERRIWDRAPGRKRQRGWDDIEIDGQVRDKLRRRERCNTGSWKDRDYREARGYWEREKETNELVFRVGSWESCRNRDDKVNSQKSNKCAGSSEEKKADEPKEKLPEEQARQYQLDVLEQAKKRNTIAFLETGAGKTLIAVLLMRSVSTELQKQNKKMLAVFLVPKVPLVYQVVSQ